MRRYTLQCMYFVCKYASASGETRPALVPLDLLILTPPFRNPGYAYAADHSLPSLSLATSHHTKQTAKPELLTNRAALTLQRVGEIAELIAASTWKGV